MEKMKKNRKKVEKNNIICYIENGFFDLHRREEMKKIITNAIFTIYLIIAIFVTICLLSYNDYKVSVFGNTSFIIVSDNKLEPFSKGDLLIVENDEDIEKGDQILYYNTYNEKVKVKIGMVTDVQKGVSETKYSIDGTNYSSKFVIGRVSDTKYMKNVGTVLGIFESKWGFLFLIVLPALLAFVNQLIVVVSGIKEVKENGMDE